jgi:hypothetical protein
MSKRFAALVGICALLPAGCPQNVTTDSTADQSATDGTTVVENNAPFASAGADFAAIAGALVVLDGSASSDPDFDKLAFIWRQIAGSPEVELADAFSSRPKFTVPATLSQSVTLTFRLTVADGFAADFDEVVVQITPAIAN